MELIAFISKFFKLAQDKKSAILSLDVTPENIESVLEQLVSSAKNINSIKYQELQLFELLNKMQLKHSANEYHKGETIIEHTREVLENVNRLAEGLADEEKQLLKLTALFHDLGKAYTWRKEKGLPDENNIRFHGHADVSVEILSALFDEGTKQTEEFKKVLSLVKEHDWLLYHTNKPTQGLKYTKNITESEPYKVHNLFRLQKLFSHADSVTAWALQETIKKIAEVDRDIIEYDVIQKKNAEQAEKRRKQLDQIVQDKKDSLFAFFDRFPVADELKSAYPDMKAIRAIIGRNTSQKEIGKIMGELNKIVPAK